MGIIVAKHSRLYLVVVTQNDRDEKICNTVSRHMRASLCKAFRGTSGHVHCACTHSSLACNAPMHESSDGVFYPISAGLRGAGCPSIHVALCEVCTTGEADTSAETMTTTAKQQWISRDMVLWLEQGVCGAVDIMHAARS